MSRDQTTQAFLITLGILGLLFSVITSISLLKQRTEIQREPTKIRSTVTILILNGGSVLLTGLFVVKEFVTGRDNKVLNFCIETLFPVFLSCVNPLVIVSRGEAIQNMIKVRCGTFFKRKSGAPITGPGSTKTDHV